ncbi:MAG: hypothetical protein WBF93_12055 [Pirellulales bacterium]
MLNASSVELPMLIDGFQDHQLVSYPSTDRAENPVGRCWSSPMAKCHRVSGLPLPLSDWWLLAEHHLWVWLRPHRVVAAFPRYAANAVANQELR